MARACRRLGAARQHEWTMPANEPTPVAMGGPPHGAACESGSELFRLAQTALRRDQSARGAACGRLRVHRRRPARRISTHHPGRARRHAELLLRSVWKLLVQISREPVARLVAAELVAGAPSADTVARVATGCQCPSRLSCGCAGAARPPSVLPICCGLEAEICLLKGVVLNSGVCVCLWEFLAHAAHRVQSSGDARAFD